MATDYSLGFISANFVARVDDYGGGSVDDWHDLAVRTREAHDPREATDWFGDVADVGFDGISLWTAHCWYHTADRADVEAVVDAAADHGLELYAYAGDFGSPPADGEADPRRDWERTFATAADLGCEWLAGRCEPDRRDLVADLGEAYGVGFAYENHPEESVEEVRAAVAGYEDSMGVAFDTGWAGTQGFDAADAIRELDDLLSEVHLKDVESVGGHETCLLGDGVVDVRACLRALEDIGFDGWVTVEHEPFDRDPMPEVRRSVARLRRWEH